MWAGLFALRGESMQPQEILRYCAEVLKKIGFSEISVKDDILYYKGEPLARWLLRVYPVSEEEVSYRRLWGLGGGLLELAIEVAL
jgi:hypothetical protein